MPTDADGSEPPNRRDEFTAACSCLVADLSPAARRLRQSKTGRLRNSDCVSSMNLQVDVERVFLAQKTVRAGLVAGGGSRGRWGGRVASWPFAPAAAVSALVVAHPRDTVDIL